MKTIIIKETIEKILSSIIFMFLGFLIGLITYSFIGEISFGFYIFLFFSGIILTGITILIIED